MVVCLPVDTFTKEGPILLSEIIIFHAIAIADLADSDSFEDASRPQLLIHNLVIEVTVDDRGDLVWFDAPNVLRAGLCDALYQLLELILKLVRD